MMKKRILFLLCFFFIFIGIKAHAEGYGVGSSKNGERPNVDIGVITKNNGYTIGPDEKKVYLTFDCGYENGYTSRILDTLKEHNVSASFFITGHYLRSATNLVKRMNDEGHLVCNHTDSHKDFTKSSKEQIMSDINKLELEYKETIGSSLPKIVRPPRGEYNKMSMELLNQNGYKTIFWSLAFKDWEKDKYIGNHYSYNMVMNRVHNGAIILLHSVSRDNCEDLSDIILEIKNRGFDVASLDTLS